VFPALRIRLSDRFAGSQDPFLTNREKWTGAIAFGALGLLFGLIPGVAIAVAKTSLGAIVVGVLISVFAAVLFAYAAWESYERPASIAETPPRWARNAAIALLVGRFLLYPIFIVVGLVFAKSNVVVAGAVILGLVATQIGLSILVARRVRGSE